MKNELTPVIENIAPLESMFSLRYAYYDTLKKRTINNVIELTWLQIVRSIAPSLISSVPSGVIKNCLDRHITEVRGEMYSRSIFSSDLDTVKIQLAVHGIIAIYEAPSVGGGVHEYIKLTELGKRILYEAIAVRISS